MAFVVGFALVVAVTNVHAQDLAAEWLSVRAAVDGMPMTLTTAELAEVYEVSAPRTHPPYFNRTVDTGTPAQILLNLPLLAIPFDALPAAAIGLTFITALGFGIVWERLGMRWAVALMPLLVLSYPGIENLRHGQFGFLVAALLAATVHLVRDGDRWWYGVPLGLAVALKVNLWFVLPALFFVKRRKAALGGIAAVICSNLPGLLLPGLSLRGLIDLAQTVGGDQARSQWNASITGIFNLPWWSAFFLGAVALVVLARSTKALDLSIPLSLLLSPIALHPYLIALLVPARWGMSAVLLGWWFVPVFDMRFFVLMSIVLAFGWLVMADTSQTPQPDRGEFPDSGSR